MDGLDQLEADLQRVVHAVSARVKNHLLENIQKYIYDYGDGKRTVYYNGAVEPTYEFYNSIIEEMTLHINDYVEYTISSDPDRMECDTETGLHGDYYDGEAVDNRENLMKYLNENISSLGEGWWTKRQPFFDITLQELDSGLVCEFFEDEMAKLGIDWSL